MVLAGCLIEKSIEPELKKLGVKDSKQLTAKRREVLAEEIKKISKFHITLTHPYEIDQRTAMGVNLNKVEAIKAAEIINNLNKGNRRIKVVLDCPSNNIKAWRDYLLTHINNLANLEIICEWKADVNHLAVSAASILAKTTRDFEIEKIKKKIGIDFGSGYPADPLTIDFLDKYFAKFRKDGIFRETWGTVSDHIKKKEQKKLF